MMLDERRKIEVPQTSCDEGVKSDVVQMLQNVTDECQVYLLSIQLYTHTVTLSLSAYILLTHILTHCCLKGCVDYWSSIICRLNIEYDSHPTLSNH